MSFVNHIFLIEFRCDYQVHKLYQFVYQFNYSLSGFRKIFLKKE